MRRGFWLFMSHLRCPLFKGGVVVLLLLGLASPLFHTAPVESATRDYWPTENWQTTSPESQGLNSTRLEGMYEYIQDQIWGFTIHSIVVVRNGYIVFERYPHWDYDENQTHIIYSCTKSVISALVGIAIDRGYIQGVNQTLLSFFPDHTVANLDSRKEAITLEHLLTMTPGFEWDEWTNNSYERLQASANWVQYMLNLPMVADPGAEWVYSTGVSHLLSAIVNASTNLTTGEFAEEYLFEPLGIQRGSWGTDPQGIHEGGNSLFLTPRDMAKFGYLYLNNGTWEGQQIISSEWVKQSSSPLVAATPPNWYGYQWWVRPDSGMYDARGHLSQHIMVIPEHDLVVVFTAGAYNYDELYNLVLEYIIPESPGMPLSSLSYFDTFILAVTIVGVPVILVVINTRRKPQI